ncbi:hypothetical protein [Burkholderia vietnamiensis]|uniref:hypothetical protein n=1 Tax=Burkholderia vietnamiensis TaxID=60552 RepID=UPI000A8B6CDA|nr:hypothetical protein [Burkholderia vietnamiensis]
MFSTLTEKLLVGALAVLMVTGSGLAVYAGYEKLQNQKAQIAQLQAENAQEKANTAAALNAASAVAAALDARSTAAASAQHNHTASTAQLASAAAANPSTAAVVPEAIWSAIFGSTSNAK